MKSAGAIVLALALVACVERAGPGDGKGPLAQYVLDAPPAVVPLKLETVFSAKVRLIGARVEGVGAAGSEVKVTMYWQALDAVGEGYRLYTHLLDERGNRVANLDDVGPLRDTRSGQPALPPSAWQRGKVYVDEQTFTVPAATTSWVLVTGLWRGTERLAITSGAADAEGRAIVARGPAGSAPVAPPSRDVPEMRVVALPADVAPPTIDGKLDDLAWQRASSTGALVDVATGGPNSRLPWNANVRVTWDDTYLYVGADVLDEKVLGGFSPGDVKDPHLWEKQCVELMIEPGAAGTNQGYYEIQISPQNLIFDSQFDSYNAPRGGPQGPFGHEEWAIAGRTAVRVDGTVDKDDDVDKGYVVEAAIPWTSFARAPHGAPRDGDVWRMNFYAMKRNDGVAWSPILGEGNFHKASRFGRVVFVRPGPPAASASAVASSTKPAAKPKPR